MAGLTPLCPPATARRAVVAVVALAVVTAACTSAATPDTTAAIAHATMPATTGPTTTNGAGRSILGLTLPGETAERYQPVEIAVEMDAVYDNPFDQRQVALDAVFTGPDGSTWDVPGFWDGEGTWRLRFTPSLEGAWTVAATVADAGGRSEPAMTTFDVTASDRPGWLVPGDRADPSLSPRYLVHHDGTSWYGVGYADLDMSLGGLDDDGFGKFDDMAEWGGNHEMWWPTWAFNYFAGSYDTYSAPQMRVIDLALADAEASGVAVTFTVWTHQYLRTAAHPWGRAKWDANGFSKLVGLDEFWTDNEAWAWQENLYRYIIARWAHSPALAMWQTVTEINGTESFEHTDAWHERVNAYFQEHDPYRHPTTATGSGGWDWPAGHAVMDVPQMHVYEEFTQDPIRAAELMAKWTQVMWDREEKPNWIGEYGERGNQYYPAMLHHSTWAAFAAGAAMTPIEWNDGQYDYGRFTDEMKQTMAHHRSFVDRIHLAEMAPGSIDVVASDPEVRGWARGGDRGGFLWVQDFALQGAGLEVQQADTTIRAGVEVELAGWPEGDWTAEPYDTWTGEWLDAVPVSCGAGACTLTLPDFHSDLALLVLPAN